MQLDTRQYERLKAKGRISLAKDPNNPTTHVIASRERFNEEGDKEVVTEVISLAEVQEIRLKTNQERNRLDSLITDITTTLGDV